jgi:hypothetical protein
VRPSGRQFCQPVGQIGLTRQQRSLCLGCYRKASLRGNGGIFARAMLQGLTFDGTELVLRKLNSATPPSCGDQARNIDQQSRCLDDGLVDAVSIHPYVDPEVVAPEYEKAKALVDAAAGGRAVPVMSTEWGFATNKFVSDDLQADVLVRMFLINLSLGIPLSIAYVAVDRTEEYVPEEERTYGIARADHTPKAAYHSLREMNGRLAGVRFREALPVAPGDVALVFEGAGRRWVAAWTAGEPREAEVAGQTVALTSRPVYLDG